jgi:hypothetical protein
MFDLLAKVHLVQLCSIRVFLHLEWHTLKCDLCTFYATPLLREMIRRYVKYQEEEDKKEEMQGWCFDLFGGRPEGFALIFLKKTTFEEGGGLVFKIEILMAGIVFLRLLSNFLMKPVLNCLLNPDK